MEAFVQIDKYILGKLDAEEQKLFEQELSTDQELQQEVSFRREMLVGLAEIQKDNLISQFQSFDQGFIPLTQSNLEVEEWEQPSEPTDSTAKVRSLRSYLAIAASIAVLIFASIWLVRGYMSSPSQEQLYANYLEVATVVDAEEIQRGQSPKEKIQAYEDWEDAAKHYNQGNYSEALTAMIQIDKSNLKSEDQSKFLYQLGLIKMLLGDFAEAKSIFDQPTVKQREPDNAAWYSAMLLLQLEEDKSKIIETLSPIAKSSTNPWASDAAKLIEELQ